MNVLLVNPACGFQEQVKSAPLGLLSIGTYIKERGHQVRMYDRKLGRLSPKKAVQGFQPEVVGVSVASSAEIRDGIRISRWFRALGLPVVWGGQFSSLIPETILRDGGADYVVIEEGEITFYELVQALENKSELSQVKGIAYLGQSGEMCRTPAREFADLADFPMIDWSLIDVPKYFFPSGELNRDKVLCLYSSKGCPGQCAFCYNKVFHHSKCRYRPNEHVMGEIEVLATKFGMNGVYFVDDDMFGADKSDMRDFCQRLIKLDLGISWRCLMRVSRLSREDMKLMYDAGCRRIFVGLESGSPEVQKRMRKKIDLTTIESVIRNCNEIGIQTTCAFVLGFPGETEAQLRDTAQLMKRLVSSMNLMHVLAYFPVPCSEAYNALVEAGKLRASRTLRQWSKYRQREDIFDNFSDAPTRDMRVVQAYFVWQSLQYIIHEKGSKRHGHLRNRIVNLLRGILQHNLFVVLMYSLSLLKYFLFLFWYSHAYPGIRKKYELE